MAHHHVYIPISEMLKFEKMCVIELMKYSSSLKKILNLFLDLVQGFLGYLNSKFSLMVVIFLGDFFPLTMDSATLYFLIFFFFFFFCLFAFSRAVPVAYGGSQAKGPVGAVAASLCQSHRSSGSEPRL